MQIRLTLLTLIFLPLAVGAAEYGKTPSTCQFQSKDFGPGARVAKDGMVQDCSPAGIWVPKDLANLCLYGGREYSQGARIPIFKDSALLQRCDHGLWLPEDGSAAPSPDDNV